MTQTKSTKIKTKVKRVRVKAPHAEYIRLKPFGVNLWGDGSRPVLLLKGDDKDQNSVTLPVPLNPLEAGVTLSQSTQSAKPATAHRATQEILKSLELSITKCIFEEVRQQRQYVRLFLENHPRMDSILLLAEDVMSLCLYLDVPLLANLEFIQNSRVMVAEVEGMMEGIKVNPQILRRNHTYIQ